ncbi:MAG: S8 family serine peptidase [Calditrichaceae bacterium]|nr:S8 family serine peptidase [Calditrichaceae bacterium]
MRNVIFVVVMLLLAFMFVSCEKESMIEVEKTQSLPDVQQKAKTSDDAALKSGPGLPFTLTDNYIVEFSGSVEQLSEAVSLLDGTVDEVFSEISLAKVTGLTNANAKLLSKVKSVKTVARDISVQWIDPDANLVEEHIGENESFWPYQWGPVAISAPQAWDAGYTGEGVRVAVIDGGISSAHLDLDDNIDFNYSASFVPGMNFDEDTDDFRHASHVAGIIAAEDNNLGTIGIAPNATIVSVKVLDGGSGSFANIIQGILYAAMEADADVINMSLGGYLPKNDDISHLKNALIKALNYANHLGVTVVASAGNDAIDMDHVGPWIHVPGDLEQAINVSATGPVDFAFGATNFDRPASYTNYGQRVIDFAAPGGDYVSLSDYWFYDMILSPSSVDAGGSWYGFAAGTSMATPHVAGVAALIIEKTGGNLNPAQVEVLLKQSADDLGKPGKDDYYGHGRVNAYKAVTQ